MEYLRDIYLLNLNAVANNGGFIRILSETHWCIEPHRFNQHKFYYVTKGSFSINIDGISYTAKPGDWFFIPAHTLHSYKNDSDCGFEKFWMHFDLYPSDTDFFKLLGLPYCVSASADKESFEFFSEYASIDGQTLENQLKIKACLLRLLACYISLADCKKTEITHDSDKRIDELLRFINNNLGRELANDELAKRCYLHPNHFIRVFKKKTGETPARYIKRCRMDAAKRLLEDSNLYISEIAESVGISDAGYFSKQFKLFYSMSPHEYRKHYHFHLQSAEKQLENKP